MNDVSHETFVTFDLPGEPRGWERPRATIRNRRIHWYVSEDETRYRDAIGWAAKAAMHSKLPTDKPVGLFVQAFMPIPPSWAKLKKQAARTRMVWPTGKPDADNIAKVIADALIGIVFVDDALVCDCRVTKRYADEAGLRITVWEIK